MEPNLFNIPDTPVKRDFEGKFAPKCDGEPQTNVKRHLEAGLGITVQTCLKLYRTTELRRIISRLRKAGMNITDTWHKDEKGRNEYKIYRLKKVVNHGTI